MHVKSILSVAMALAALGAGVRDTRATIAPARAGNVTSNTPPPVSSGVGVKIDNFSFGPTTLKVTVGTTVTWTNRDDTPHTVVSKDGVFKSKVLDTGETFSYTFAKPGTFPYFCSIHPKMTGEVVVQ